MDKKEVGGDLSEDLTRESLIAISYRLPDKDPYPGPGLPKTFNSEDVAEIVNNDGGSEKYRSKLISISYTQSPDAKGLPVSPGAQKVYP